VLKTPSNDTVFELSREKSISFSWSKVSVIDGYTVKFALSEDGLENSNAGIDAGNTNVYATEPAELYNIMFDVLKIPANDYVDVYWTVMPTLAAERNHFTTRVNRMSVKLMLPHQLSADGIHFGADPTGEVQFLDVNLSSAWTISGVADWLSVNPTSGNGQDFVALLPSANTGAARSTTITVSSAGNEKIYLTVTQNAAGVVKLLSKLYSSDHNHALEAEFEYDEYMRLVKINDYGIDMYGSSRLLDVVTIEYHPEKIIIVDAHDNALVQNITRDGNNLLCKIDGRADTAWYIQNLTSANLPETFTSRVLFKVGINVYEYDETGNLSGHLKSSSLGYKVPVGTIDQIKHGEVVQPVERLSYTYDDKKSPFYACTSPKWLIMILCNTTDFFNNAVSLAYGNETPSVFAPHEYDNDGYITENRQRAESYLYE
jgi:hypothetical protein